MTIEPQPTTQPTAETPARNAPARPRPMSRRLREWLRAIHHDPGAEERAAEERRGRLLAELSDATANSSDDIPLFETMGRLNHHYED